jgi:hypothetical protein
VDGIISEFPNSRIAFVTRDPIAFIQSAFKRGWMRSDTIWENNRIAADKYTDPDDRLGAIANYWVEVNQHLQSKAKMYPANIRHFRFEDVLSSEGEVARMLDFCDIPLSSLRANIGELLRQRVNENRIRSWEHSGVKKSRHGIDVERFLDRYSSEIGERWNPLAKSLGYDFSR